MSQRSRLRRLQRDLRTLDLLIRIPDPEHRAQAEKLLTDIRERAHALAHLEFLNRKKLVPEK